MSNKSSQSKRERKSNHDSYQKIISSRGSGRHNKDGDFKIYDLTYVYLPVETVRVCAGNKGFNVKIMVIPGRTSLLKRFSEINHFSPKCRRVFLEIFSVCNKSNNLQCVFHFEHVSSKFE